MKIFILVVAAVILNQYVVTYDIDDVYKGIEGLFIRLLKMERRVQNIDHTMEDMYNSIDSNTGLLQKMDSRIDNVEKSLTDQKNISKHQGDMLKKQGDTLKKQDDTLKKQGDTLKKQVDTLRKQGESLDGQGKLLGKLKTGMEATKDNINNLNVNVNNVETDLTAVKKDMSQQHSAPGWKFIGRGTFGTVSDSTLNYPVSFNECIQFCEKKHVEDFGWNGMAWRPDTKWCYCYENDKGHDSSHRYKVWLHFKNDE